MYAFYQRLNVHVFASNLTLIRAARTKLAPHCRNDPALRAERKSFYRDLIKQHQAARDLFTRYRF